MPDESRIRFYRVPEYLGPGSSGASSAFRPSGKNGAWWRRKLERTARPCRPPLLTHVC